MNELRNEILEKFKKLTPEKQKEEKKWIVDRLKEIDKGAFDTLLFLDHPIRFHIETYRHVVDKDLKHI
ncbi:hypothetical protein ACVVIH_12965 [Chryseobacterium arthrosphaerae]|uniref:hypothetical protein n=1 Tax=Chryseobacterium arthrosphaerae TaxID=651561 RepID=UPI00241EAD12|nr:hypothetical protein [Chryseobacterium arthrosphaerae]